jgi:hypothetical protein
MELVRTNALYNSVNCLRVGPKCEDNIKSDLKEICCDDLGWIHVSQCRFQCLVNTEMNGRFVKGARDSLTCSGIVRFSRWILLRGVRRLLPSLSLLARIL